MAADFENMGYEAVPKSIPRIKMTAEPDLRVSEAQQPTSELLMAADFKNMGFQAVQKSVSIIKMAANSIKRSQKLYDL